MPLNALYGYYVFDHIGEVRVQVSWVGETCVTGHENALAQCDPIICLRFTYMSVRA